jgi:hypothetical protein
MTLQEFEEFSFWKDHGYGLPNITVKPTEMLSINRDRVASECRPSNEVTAGGEVKNI